MKFGLLTPAPLMPVLALHPLNPWNVSPAPPSPKPSHSMKSLPDFVTVSLRQCLSSSVTDMPSHPMFSWVLYVIAKNSQKMSKLQAITFRWCYYSASRFVWLSRRISSCFLALSPDTAILIRISVEDINLTKPPCPQGCAFFLLVQKGSAKALLNRKPTNLIFYENPSWNKTPTQNLTRCKTLFKRTTSPQAQNIIPTQNLVRNAKPYTKRKNLIQNAKLYLKRLITNEKFCSNAKDRRSFLNLLANLGKFASNFGKFGKLKIIFDQGWQICQQVWQVGNLASLASWQVGNLASLGFLASWPSGYFPTCQTRWQVGNLLQHIWCPGTCTFNRKIPHWISTKFDKKSKIVKVIFHKGKSASKFHMETKYLSRQFFHI